MNTEYFIISEEQEGGAVAQWGTTAANATICHETSAPCGIIFPWGNTAQGNVLLERTERTLVPLR